MGKLSEQFRQHRRAEKIEEAFYAVDRALKANQLLPYVCAGTKLSNTAWKYRDICFALRERAAEMVVEAFDGTMNGKRIKKAPR